MSVCDEGWGGRGRCPCLLLADVDLSLSCTLGLWDEYTNYHTGEPPATCPHAAALKAVAEDPEKWKLLVVEETVYRAMMMSKGIGAARGE